MEQQTLGQFTNLYLSYFPVEQLDRLLLMTDRTAADVEEAAALKQKLDKEGLDSLTQAERDKWYCGLKGNYNQEDMVRVSLAVERIAGLLERLGYEYGIEAKTDWTYMDVPFQEDLEAYLGNIRTLAAGYCVKPTTPALPINMNAFDWQQANALEKNLQDIASLLKNMVSSFPYCGDVECGA